MLYFCDVVYGLFKPMTEAETREQDRGPSSPLPMEYLRHKHTRKHPIAEKADRLD
jgi:hypothetical protein